MTTVEVRQCSSEEYHSHPAIGQSALKLFLRDPLLYYDRYVARTAPPSEPSASMQFGLDFERLLFHDQLPGVMIPNDVLSQSNRDGKVIYSRRGAAWQEWRERTIAEHGEGVELIRQDEWEKRVTPLLVARDRMMEHDRAVKLLDGEKHLSYFWTDERTGLDLKCQFDCVSRWNVLVDLKTAAGVTPDEFSRSVVNYGYHIQAHWYRNAHRLLTGDDLQFAFVVVKNKPSYCCECFTLHDDWYEIAALVVRDGLDRLAKAYETGSWFSPTHGTIIDLAPPRWAWDAADVG